MTTPFVLVPLIVPTMFLVACSGSSGSSGDGRSPSGSGPIAPGFSASSNLVEPGSTVILSWNLSARSCIASGGWNGERPATGSEQVGPISVQTTYTLTCSSDTGTIIEIANIRVNGSVSLSWVPPTHNTDGTELNDLAGYRIYTGEHSRTYEQMLELADPMATDTRITLPSGEHHIAMTALDLDGNESAYSNEVRRRVP